MRRLNQSPVSHLRLNAVAVPPFLPPHPVRNKQNGLEKGVRKGYNRVKNDHNCLKWLCTIKVV